jgi:hypothetical protein
MALRNRQRRFATVQRYQRPLFPRERSLRARRCRVSRQHRREPWTSKISGSTQPFRSAVYECDEPPHYQDYDCPNYCPNETTTFASFVPVDRHGSHHLARLLTPYLIQLGGALVLAQPLRRTKVRLRTVPSGAHRHAIFFRLIHLAELPRDLSCPQSRGRS